MAETKKLTPREQEKLDIINDLLSHKIKNGQAAAMLGITTRQVKRLKKKVREQGALAVVHSLKGRGGNHHIDNAIKEKVLEVIEEKYADFKPTFATEKLEENHSITISYGTTRLWMIEKGLWKPRKQKQVIYRSWRARRDYLGEMQQFDGSYHYWFENRYCNEGGNPIEVCLLVAIDDATGRITKAQFTTNEGVEAVFTFWKEYILKCGKPGSMYLDRFSTYKINHKAAIDNRELITQFQRAMKTLSIELITAHSPEAKGRVERVFQTLQDRLVKEMRLVGITTPEEGNRFLEEIFLPKFNNKFSVIPAKNGDVHRALLPSGHRQIHHIFSIHDTRRINRDFTIQFKNNWYQLTEVQPTTVRPTEKVLIETWLDHTVHIILKDKELAYFLLSEKPKKQTTNHPLILTTHKLNYKPPANHPWKTRTLPSKG